MQPSPDIKLCDTMLKGKVPCRCQPSSSMLLRSVNMAVNRLDAGGPACMACTVQFGQVRARVRAMKYRVLATCAPNHLLDV